MDYIESGRDLDDVPTFGVSARYIYLDEEYRQRRTPAGRVFYRDNLWHGICYHPGRFNEFPVSQDIDRQVVIDAVVSFAQSRVSNRIPGQVLF